MDNVVINTVAIDDIWEKYIWKKYANVKNLEKLNPRDKIEDRGYHIEKELPKGGILFLGMNPSYPKGTEDDTKKRTYIRKKDKDTFVYGDSYNLEKIKETCFKQKEDLKDEDIRTQKYWKPIVDAAVRITQENIEMQIMQLKQMLQENTGRKKEDIELELKRLRHRHERCDRDVEFCHHDLFFVRETNQKKVLSLRANCRSFFAEQLKYTINLIEAAAPKIIIVINGGAGNLIREELGTDFFGFIPATKNDVGSWNEDCGVDIVKIGEREVPIIFTGMLSSTGRINKGTETTLFWNIRHIARQLEITF